MHLTTTIYLFLFSLAFVPIHQNIRFDVQQTVSQDTLSKLSLRNKIYGSDKYTLMLLENIDNNVHLLTTRKDITLNKNGRVIATILLPLADAEAKNFSVTGISETKQGFKIAVNWGGGNYIYDVDYYFVYRNRQFNFSELRSSMYGPNSPVKKITKAIRPSMPISEFDIMDYLNNH